jgi:hypothetical protein
VPSSDSPNTPLTRGEDKPGAISPSAAVILVGDTFISLDMEACLAWHTFPVFQMVVVRAGEAFIASAFLTLDRREFALAALAVHQLRAFRTALAVSLSVRHAFVAIPMEADNTSAAALVLVSHAFVAIPMEADDTSAAALVLVSHAFMAIPVEADDTSAAALLFALVVRPAFLAVPMHAIGAFELSVPSLMPTFEARRAFNPQVQKIREHLWRGSLIQLALALRCWRKAKGFGAGTIRECRGIRVRRLHE